MIGLQRCSVWFRVVLLAAVLGPASGCTLFGGGFEPEQPQAEVTVQGKINIDRASGQQSGCSSGTAMFWGTARNSGDLDVDDVYIEIDALDANNAVLGTYRVHVFNGNVEDITTETTTGTETTTEVVGQIAGTSLAVDESGTFEACSNLPYDSVAGTAYRTDYITVSEAK